MLLDGRITHETAGEGWLALAALHDLLYARAREPCRRCSTTPRRNLLRLNPRGSCTCFSSHLRTLAYSTVAI